MYGWGDISERSFKGQVGSNFQRHPICMNDISNCSSCLVHFKNVYFYYIPAFISEIITFKQIRTVILKQEVPMCKLLIFHYRKSIRQIIPIFTPNVFCSKHILSLKIWVQYMMKHDLQKISKTLNHFFSKLIWCRHFFDWTLQFIIT